ncbi:MAG TPA: DUF4214 domain-containing protein [Noviherbaspirillum sp.]|nr:DUF4214 domain-containing protein [Noviherbaspirillum sp.]
MSERPAGNTDRFAAVLAADYNNVVQQLYIAYFGRPADPNGLANFTAQLAAENAPSNIQAFNTAYSANPNVKKLIDSFGTSAESNALYTGGTESFLTSIYTNVLGRAPDPEGLRFWIDAIDNRGLTKANASFSIMAGALINSSPQGLVDAALIRNRVDVATRFTSSLDTPTEVNSYSGDRAAAVARGMLAKVNQNTDPAGFQGTIDSTIASLTRTSTDRPDELTGPQVHVIYAIPSDGNDAGLDMNETLSRTTGSLNNWLAGQTGGRRLRFDTFSGVLDVTFVTLPKTDAAYEGLGDGKRAGIEQDLASLGLVVPGKIYLVYYDGSNPRNCVDPSTPGVNTGQVAVMYLKGCGGSQFAGTATTAPGVLEFRMLRGILRTLGAVSATAPNYVPDGYVNSDPSDVMYQGPLAWTPSILDYNKQNYYNPAGLGAGIFNLATSPYLSQ